MCCGGGHKPHLRHIDQEMCWLAGRSLAKLSASRSSCSSSKHVKRSIEPCIHSENDKNSYLSITSSLDPGGLCSQSIVLRYRFQRLSREFSNSPDDQLTQPPLFWCYWGSCPFRLHSIHCVMIMPESSDGSISSKFRQSIETRLRILKEGFLPLNTIFSRQRQ